MPRTLIWAGALLLIVAAACGGDGGGGPPSNRDIADTLTGFAEAFAGGEADELAGYWSSECEGSTRSLQMSAARTFKQLFEMVVGEGDYRIAIDAGKLDFDVIDDTHVIVPLDQPEGAVVATIGGRPIPSGSGQTLVSEVPIALAREDGEWRVTTCELFVSEDAGEEEQ